MGFLSNLKDKLFGKKKRKLVREQLFSFLKLTVIVDDVKYSIQDFTVEGFALVNSAKTQFEIGKTYSCHIMLKDESRLTIKFKVMRADGGLVGCKVMDQEMFARFVKNNLTLPNKI